MIKVLANTFERPELINEHLINSSNETLINAYKSIIGSSIVEVENNKFNVISAKDAQTFLDSICFYFCSEHDYDDLYDAFQPLTHDISVARLLRSKNDALGYFLNLFLDLNIISKKVDENGDITCENNHLTAINIESESVIDNILFFPASCSQEYRDCNVISIYNREYDRSYKLDVCTLKDEPYKLVELLNQAKVPFQVTKDGLRIYRILNTKNNMQAMLFDNHVKREYDVNVSKKDEEAFAEYNSLYWVSDEIQESPVEVIGAITGALCSNKAD
ncbi:hypothetical protein I3271_09255 [Photobacterium leiognathi]|uniref:hypothetical protein n=1 Tax=Photobacterium leiognathi TaxID=553611 RepID=UPI001EDE4BF1|nr:hypothetical protein [Photobacterium leiognathi]MCG3884875.1 hypothetical protein [Photobacterium leiognathi]